MQPNESSPEVFKHYIQTLFEEDSLEVNDFLFWAEKAQGHTYDISSEEAVPWYKNAMLIYDFLLTKKDRSFFAMNHIYMRLNIICIYGYHDARSKPYLDEIVSWIRLGMADLPVKELEKESSSWMALPIGRICELRMLKMRLKIAQQLQENDVLLNDDITGLMSLIPQLP